MAPVGAYRIGVDRAAPTGDATVISSVSTTWEGWNAGFKMYVSSATATDTITMTNSTWAGWNYEFTTIAAGLTGTATATSLIWKDWNSDLVASRGTVATRPAIARVDQQRAERLMREQAEAKKRQEQLAEQRRLIEERAERWLLEHLNPEQERQYLKERQFIVYSRDSQRRYLITGENAWVYELNADGQRIRSFCIHSRESLPKADEICAKKILLEADEREFLKVANATDMRAA